MTLNARKSFVEAAIKLLNVQGVIMYTGYWIDDNYIWGPEESGKFWIDDGWVWGPYNSGKWWIEDNWIWGPTDGGKFWIEDGHIYGPSNTLPWLKK